MDDSALPVKPSRRLQAGVVLGILAIAAGGYLLTGEPRLASVEPSAAVAPPTRAPETNTTGAGTRPPPDDTQVAEVVDRMAARLKEQPDNPAGWALLARAYAAMGRPAQAVQAFQKALALTRDDAALMADGADAMAARDNGQFSAEAQQLVERALTLEPGNVKAMALAGSIAFDRGDYEAAVRHWSQVESVLPTDSKILPQVRASLGRARELGGSPAKSTAPAARPPA